MPRGGRRDGAPGKSYSNRKDLNGAPSMPNVAPGQTYGARAEQQAAQRAIPVGPPPRSATPAPPAPPAGGAGGAGGGLAALLGGGSGPMPGDIRLDAPSERPAEPVTAGMPMGAGPGVEALGPLGQAGSGEDVAMALRAAYEAYPSEDLRMILERLDLG